MINHITLFKLVNIMYIFVYIRILSSACYTNDMCRFERTSVASTYASGTNFAPEKCFSFLILNSHTTLNCMSRFRDLHTKMYQTQCNHLQLMKINVMPNKYYIVLLPIVYNCVCSVF